MRTSALVLTMLCCAACASSTPSPPPSPDRVLIVDTDGKVIRQSTADENSRVFFAAPLDRVWPTLMLAYDDLGLQPTVSNRSSGRYGNAGFIAPRRLMGRPLGEFFSCGSGLTGPVIETGRLYGNVVSTLTDDGKGGTIVMTHVSASLSRNDGTSTNPITCASTGAIEEYIRSATEKRLGVK